MTATRPRVLAVLPAFIPSTMITVVKPLVQLHRAGRLTARVTLESRATPGDVRWADLVVFCRNIEPMYAALLDAARAHGIPVLYDLDDNFFELPPDCDVAGHFRAPDRQAMLADYVRTASLVRVYSKPLAARVAALNPRVERTFAPVDMSLIAPPAATRAADVVSIVYATCRVQDALSPVFLPAVTRVLDKYPGRVHAHFWGYKSPLLPAGATYHSPICDYERFLRRFSRAGYQIGLAPLLDDTFCRSKTNNKFREYGACGIAGIYSNVDVYSDCVRDGETGLLVANDPDRWHEALVRLIEDRPLRTAIQQRARAYVDEHYCQERFEQVFWRQIQQALAAGKEARCPGKTPAAAASVAAGEAYRRRRRPWLLARLRARCWRLAEYLRHYGPRGTRVALGWQANDRRLLLQLRYQLWRPWADLRAWLSSLRKSRVP